MKNELVERCLSLFLSLIYKSMKFCTLLLFIWISLGGPAASAQTTLKAFDAHRNTMVELVLNDNGTYRLKEWFYDGSVLNDTGKWSQEATEIVLFSQGKANRVHPFEKYKKHVKLKGDRILIGQGTITFKPRHRRSEANYYQSFKWVQLPVQHTPTQ